MALTNQDEQPFITNESQLEIELVNQGFPTIPLGPSYKNVTFKYALRKCFGIFLTEEPQFKNLKKDGGLQYKMEIPFFGFGADRKHLRAFLVDSRAVLVYFFDPYHGQQEGKPEPFRPMQVLRAIPIAANPATLKMSQQDNMLIFTVDIDPESQVGCLELK